MNTFNKISRILFLAGIALLLSHMPVHGRQGLKFDRFLFSQDTVRTGNRVNIDDPPIHVYDFFTISFTNMTLNTSATPTLSYEFPYTGGQITFAVNTSLYDSASELMSAMNAQLTTSWADTLMTVTSATAYTSGGTTLYYTVTATMRPSSSETPREIGFTFNTNPSLLSVVILGAPSHVVDLYPVIDTTTTDLHLPVLTENLAQENETLVNWIKKTTYTGDNPYTPTDSIIDITYYNSLGFPKQTIEIAATPNQHKNLVKPSLYNPLGQAVKDLLPYPSSSGAVAPEAGACSSQQSYYQSLFGSSENAPFSQSVALPGSTAAIKQFKPGRVFHDQNRFIESVHSVSQLRDSIPILEVGESNGTVTLTFRGYYPDGALRKEISADEDGHLVAKFSTTGDEIVLEREYIYDLSLFSALLQEYSLANTDGGKTVPKDKYNSIIYSPQTKKSDVAYVKDIFQQLRLVISPEGEKQRRSLQTTAGGTLTIVSASAVPSTGEIWAKEWCYTYGYDGRRNLNWRRLPGKTEEYYVNDLGGRAVAYQDGNMRAKGEWLLTAYDYADRIVTQYLTAAYTKAQLETLFAQPISYTSLNFAPYNNAQNVLLSQAEYYSKEGSASARIALLPSALQFAPRGGIAGWSDVDTVNFAGAPLYDRVLAMPSLEEYMESVNPSTGIGNTALLKYRQRAYYYDKQNRPLQTLVLYPDGAVLASSNAYDYVGDVKKMESRLILPAAIAQGGSQMELILSENFTYDHRSRPTGKTSMMMKVTGTDTLSSIGHTVGYMYDELGQLVRTTIGRTGSISSEWIEVEQSYNLQGWLTNQTNSHLLSAGGPILISEIYSQALRYYSPVKSQTTALFSGNISEWQTTQKNTTATTLAFNYDCRGFYISADRYSGNGSFPQLSGTYAESNLTYDLNGNPLTLTRLGNSSMRAFHNFTYSYTGNKVSSITGSVSVNEHASKPALSSVTAAYAYDANGNMTSDGLENVTLEYDLNNMIRTVKGPNEADKGVYNYFFDGEKYGVEEPAGGEGRRYAGPFTLRAQSVLIGISVTTLFGFESAVPSGGEVAYLNNPAFTGLNIGTENPYLAVVYHKDHLGSTRAITKTDGTILEQNDYYPFGLRTTRGENYSTLSQSLAAIAQNANNTTANTVVPEYLYNGKEKQDFIKNTSAVINAGGSADYTSNYIDYGARFYNPTTIRWNTQDPMAEKYFTFSSYLYASNNPIYYVDKWGLYFTGWVGKTDSSGNTTYVYNPNINNEDEARAAGYDIYLPEGSTIENARIGNSSVYGTVYLGKNAKDVYYVPSNKNITPFMLGLEWLTGLGPRERNFKNGDFFTELVRTHPSYKGLLTSIAKEYLNSHKPNGYGSYSLKGLKGIPIYIRDYILVSTSMFCKTNLSFTYLGSFNYEWKLLNVSESNISLFILIKNSSSMQSALRPPVLGYISLWRKTVGKRLDSAFSKGWGSNTNQSITILETINLNDYEDK